MKILVGYDGSHQCQLAVELARQHIKAFEGELHIVTSMVGGADVPRQEFEKTEAMLKEAKDICTKDGITCLTKLLVRGSTPGEDLVQYIEENNIDEVIIGVKKKSRVGKLIFGSTAQQVILRAKCPVVTVK
jgi:nucleotide-binding universal stress UspA family protein